MAAKTNTTTSAQITVAAREIDFVSSFQKNWDTLTELLSIIEPIRKAPGTRLVGYKASVDGSLQGGDTVAEGDEIPFTLTKVEPVKYRDITMKKYAKAVTAEAVAKYGAEVAIQRTDEAFRNELQNMVLADFVSELKTGTLRGVQKNFQRQLAMAKGAVLEKFKGMNRTVTNVVGFVNILDLYSHLGDTPITVQTMFGLQYVKDYLGYSVIFLMDTATIPQGTVIATPVDNLDLYYIDPGDSDFKALGLDYTVVGETNLIGYHAEGNYSRAQGESYALMGMTIWAEYVDGIAIVTKGSTESVPAVALSGDTGNTGIETA